MRKGKRQKSFSYWSWSSAGNQSFSITGLQFVPWSYAGMRSHSCSRTGLSDADGSMSMFRFVSKTGAFSKYR